ncbi:TSUP family transporter [Tolumonas lignilytica]|jgi:Predicted permeases|uniref:TSUP family transporter n=1 Tax=Tolumonas lignilytica TaxID=1283284 RepID=UPI000466B73C|nr:TSUP family transporter [Tolumonas lignilytica]
MDFEIYTLILFFVCGIAAGFIDSIAGGGGLLTVPALLSAGIPPAYALATNKLQSSFGSFSASFYFLRHGYIDLKLIRNGIIFTFIGSACGTLAVQQIDPSVLKQAIPFMLIGFALYFIFSPRIGDEDRQQQINFFLFSLIFGGGIGFYDGFFGPGTGSFFAIAFVAMAGFNLSKATAYSKLLNFTSNIAALIFFMLGGKILWQVGIVMGAGQFVGARLGSRMVIKKGSKIIRPLLVTMSLIMSARLLWQQYMS